MSTGAKQQWDAYLSQELAGLTPILTELGYVLDDVQLHISGERYLMSGKKLVLTGTSRDGTKVVLKASSDSTGTREITSEHHTREMLGKLPFAYGALLVPKELLYIKRGKHTILISAFLEQEKNFLDRSLEEQFSLAVRALQAQEKVHATTYGHAKIIEHTFGIWGAKEYACSFLELQEGIALLLSGTAALRGLLERAKLFFETNRETIEQYAGFLTHADFLPHNLRVVGGDIYLLDHTSLHFGNKYESWARFCNFMALYNPSLEQALLQYVQNNRTPEEYLSLRLMRVYKLVFLLSFYAKSVQATTDDLHTLTQERISFWSRVLETVLNDTPLAPEIVQHYKERRDTLRSPEEKKRQQKLH